MPFPVFVQQFKGNNMTSKIFIEEIKDIYYSMLQGIILHDSRAVSKDLQDVFLLA